MAKSKYYLKVESNIMAKLKTVKDKAGGNKFGLMGHIMMANGKMIWQTVKEYFTNKEVVIMKVISKMINFMATANLLQLIKILFTKENLISINRMELVHRFLLHKTTNILEILDSMSKKAMVESIMIMGVAMKGFGKMENLMVRDIIPVKLCNIKADGKKINFMDMGKRCGRTEECIKEIM